jgi:hypothetical protein
MLTSYDIASQWLLLKMPGVFTALPKVNALATVQGKEYIIVHRREQCQVSLLSNAVKTPGIFRSYDLMATD